MEISYDGTNFSGWAVQEGRRTVAGLVNEALSVVFRVPGLETVCAGRTDAGVHARGQVAHVDLPRTAWESWLSRHGRRRGNDAGVRLRGVLPDDVTVKSVTVAPDGFDARFSALSRRYRYRLVDDPSLLDPLRRHHVVLHPNRLDVDAMNRASEPLLGIHDFAPFCKKRDFGTTIREMQQMHWERPVDGPDAGLVVLTIEADAFCYSMVRSLVGALLPVGDGRRPETWPAEVLKHGMRHSGVNVAPPHGLVLEEVTYPEVDQLQLRQAKTRVMRGREV